MWHVNLLWIILLVPKSEGYVPALQSLPTVILNISLDQGLEICSLLTPGTGHCFWSQVSVTHMFFVSFLIDAE